MTTELNILCWDHPRCTMPTRAAADEWMRMHPDTQLTLTSRPLTAFNDQPLQEVVGSVDMLFIDHPMMGTAAASGALAALDLLIPERTMQELAGDSIGSSHSTYSWKGHQWATAVDAACQVAVANEERLKRLGVRTPQSWDDVLHVARSHRDAVAIPLHPSDAFISLLSISGSLGTPYDSDDAVFDLNAIDIFVELVRFVDPRSYEWNPPRLLDSMSALGDSGPAYCPLTFGYTDYQRPSSGPRRLTFTDVPTFGQLPAGSILGGAGLAVTSTCLHQEEAAAFAAWMAAGTTQSDLVLVNGGQPASRSTWSDPAADDLVGGFFSGTRATMESSIVRPRSAWWPQFQEGAGALLVEALRTAMPAIEILSELETLKSLTRKTSSA